MLCVKIRYDARDINILDLKATQSSGGWTGLNLSYTLLCLTLFKPMTSRTEVMHFARSNRGTMDGMHNPARKLSVSNTVWVATKTSSCLTYCEHRCRCFPSFPIGSPFKQISPSRFGPLTLPARASSSVVFPVAKTQINVNKYISALGTPLKAKSYEGTSLLYLIQAELRCNTASRAIRATLSSSATIRHKFCLFLFKEQAWIAWSTWSYEWN